ncbi:MAG: outer membrane protein assembly factor BamD [Chlamydiae bacterium]|nr:outer membrane protein assembly factor BamD [Chlamydiota bacterium]
MRIIILASLVAGAMLTSMPVRAAYTIKDGKLIQTHELATMSVQEHYSSALEALEQSRWEDLVLQSNILIKNFPESPFTSIAQYYLGVGFYHLGELEMANKQLTQYLKKQSAPKFFEEAIKYKFAIADKFQNGERKHLLGLESMPKWMPAAEEAIEIYDEVISALPHHELAIQSLFGKGELLAAEEDYKLSIETYQILIRKFTKHPLACESYIGIGKVYLKECKNEYPDPDFLDLAEINFKKFTADFPNEPRIVQAENMLIEMREIYADNLYETARFYERTKKPHASAIYYNKILAKYPKTKTANSSEERLAYLEKKHNKPYRDMRTLPEVQDDVVKVEASDNIQLSSAVDSVAEIEQASKAKEDSNIAPESLSGEGSA